MSEMIERVARALIAANAPQMMNGWAEMSAEQRASEIDLGWDLWVHEARAAIEAMREPTVEMVEAVWKYGDLDWDAAAYALSDAFDAALKPTLDQPLAPEPKPHPQP